MIAHLSVEITSMTTNKDAWDKVFMLLQKFERQLIDPSLFGWKYITSSCGVSKATLWRNSAFRSEFQRVKDLVRTYRLGHKSYDTVASIKSSHAREKDDQISSLKAEVELLAKQLARERERLIYAVVIARRRNIDPREFMEDVPLTPKKFPKL